MPVEKHKQTARASFPTEFKVFDLNVDALRQDLFQIVGANATRRSTIISLPNAGGQIEQFAAQMRALDRPEEWLAVLNRLSPGADPQAGSKFKIVQ